MSSQRTQVNSGPVTIRLEVPEPTPPASAEAPHESAHLSEPFSSILEEEQRRIVAGELRRVIRSGGVLMWYDLRVDNPRNSDVRAVPSRALADLFPSWSIQLRSVTLAPPLARMVVPRSWLAAQMLSALPLLRTHALGCLRKP